MYKTIEGTYHKGKIHVPQFVRIKDKTQILLVFKDTSAKIEKKDESPTTIPLKITDESEGLKLDDINVTISSKEKYEKQLSKHYDKEIMHSRASFKIA